VLVTGSGRGIGRQVAHRFAQGGARVAVVDLVEERARSTADALTRDGGTALAVQCDVRSERSVRAMIDQVVARFGTVQVLVNCAGGYAANRPAHETPEDDWDSVVDSNLKGTFLCCKAAIPYMLRDGGGRIINFSSNAGRTSSPALGCHYTAAKAGVLGLTRHLAKEYAARNILVNAVAPGPTRDERFEEIMTRDSAATLLAQIPLGRFAEPDDLAGVVLFLASEAARYITGATLDVNGGYVML
jgi:NAD(P)-dependent dehydrogenase (short-subunit alcohol dehydrogenase family)